MTDTIQYKLKERILCQLVDGEAVLLDVEAGQYYGLNAVGVCIWQGLDEGLGVSAIQAQIVREFEVSQDEAVSDVEAFIAELSAAGLIKSSASAAK